MDLSIVIVSWNTRDYLADCLAALEATAVPDLSVETIVVDNASRDGSAAMVEAVYPGVHLICNDGNVGFARANNQGIRAGDGRYVLLLNSDTEVRAGALAAMVAFLDEHRRAGAVGARLLNSDGSLQVSCHPMITPWREFWRLTFLDRLIPRASYRASAWTAGEPLQVDVIKGACLMLRRAALEETGLLDETYFMYTEEVDLCYRLAQQGWQLWWLPAAEVVHHGEASSRQVAQAMYLQLYRSKVQFYRKFGGERRARFFKFLVFLAYLPRWLAAGLGSVWSPRHVPSKVTFQKLVTSLPQM